MTQAVDQGPRAEVPESTQYLLGRVYASAFTVDPSDPEGVLFRVRMAMRICERIESTCGWTDAVREGFRAGALVDTRSTTTAASCSRAWWRRDD